MKKERRDILIQEQCERRGDDRKEGARSSSKRREKINKRCNEGKRDVEKNIDISLKHASMIKKTIFFSSSTTRKKQK